MVHDVKHDPKVLPFKCPVCGGRGTVSFKAITCHACKGKGFILVDQNEYDKLTGVGKSS